MGINYNLIKEKLNDADGIIITASNGLSISEGINLFKDDENFKSVFSDFKDRYGLRSIIHGMSAQWPISEAKWAFWARLINKHVNNYEPSDIMKNLKKIINGKSYFIVTSNGEGHFEKAGFDENKIFEVEGNWITMASSCDSFEALYPTLSFAKEADEKAENNRIPSSLIPLCPKCKKEMEITMLTQSSSVHRRGRSNFSSFLSAHSGKNIVVLELGIGPRNELIKGPMMRITEREKNFFYVTVNLGELYILNSIKERAVGIDGAISEVLENLV